MSIHSNRKGLIGVLIVLLLIVVVIVLCIGAVMSYYQQYNITGVVEDVGIAPGDKGSTTYVVWLESGQKLEILRNTFFGANEDDLYHQLKMNIGETYSFTCYGWQFDSNFFGTYMYPCIASMTKVS